ncbi:U4/U6-U5 snRNP complex subunit lsm6 [Gnomoniopsis smithogilvyi]|uniref:U6 snRNA-associated Sm-like protein LSm6 n=1 Tax=Gnomoniopsis smithogilvyi TaxID=1191159 RepID=A0A9W9D2I2_9PEZI|nr:U4/U6-U5 snRNP complex subunit lsm6 [Gnomoniopsis smithogilvyi]
MENGAPSNEGKDPSGFLSQIIGNSVTVKLNSGVVYRGELQSVDGYMNIALEKTEEWVNGQKRRTYGDAFGERGSGYGMLLERLHNSNRCLTAEGQDAQSASARRNRSLVGSKSFGLRYGGLQ